MATNPPPVFGETATDAQLADACLSLRHDFGLLEGDERERVANTMRLHWQAVWKAVSATGPGLDELLDTQVPIGSIGRGMLHRAIVTVPDGLIEPGRLLQERIVFFEAPAGSNRIDHLERLLATAWNMDTIGWSESGLIYNVAAARELYESAIGPADSGELRLLETGAGGDGGLGRMNIHYARARDLDFFVSPPTAQRLAALSSAVELCYANGWVPWR